jgi:acetylornithine deacetylase
MDGDWVRETLQELVRIDSINPDLVPGAAGEAAIAEHCVAWLRAHDVEAWTDEVAPGRPNAVGRVSGGAGPVLILCAHLDIVSVEGMTRDPFDAALENGRVYGRGAYDMKCGAAAIMCTLAELAKDPPAGTVLAALVCDEEFASIGAQDFVKRYAADACVLTEPSEERLVLAHKGFVWLELTVKGIAAHGSRWDLGASAITRMSRIVTALDDLDRDVLRARTHPLTGPASMHCSMISGGDGWSTYAPACTLRIERRTIPGENVGDVVSEIVAAARSTGEDVDYTVVLARSPLECDRNARVARSVRNAAASVFNAEPEECGVAFWMDAAIFADAGIETVNIGASGEGAHAAVEWVDLASVIRNADVLLDASRRYFAAT